jgi:hypothetical protein
MHVRGLLQIEQVGKMSSCSHTLPVAAPDRFATLLVASLPQQRRVLSRLFGQTGLTSRGLSNLLAFCDVSL